MTEKLAILVLSCDKYSDLWDGFFYLLNKNFQVDNAKFLVSNKKKYQNQHVNDLNIIHTGEDSDWSSNLLLALEQVPNRKILIILEDIFITTPIDLSLFKSIEKFIFAEDVQHFKILTSPKAKKTSASEQISKYQEGLTYLVTVNGIWDKDYLKSLLIKGESAWQFEINGSYRAHFSSNKFFRSNTPLFGFKNMVEKGQWIKPNINWAVENQIPINAHGRKTGNVTLYFLKKYYFELIFSLPWRLRYSFSNFIKKALITY